MQEFLNEHTLYATVEMYLRENSGLALVVEGAHDHLALKAHCSPDLTLIEGTGGKPQVLKAAKLAVRRSLERARFLVDQDFDAFGSQNHHHPSNVSVSDTHDFFTDVILGDPDILPRVVEVHTNSFKRGPNAISVSSAQVDVLIKKAASLASDLAAVRIVNGRLDLSLDFKRFSFGSLNDSKLNIESIGREVLLRSQYRLPNGEQVLNEIYKTRAQIKGLSQPCYGDHDFLDALARLLKMHDIAVSSANLRNGLILAMTCKSICMSDWFQEVQQWSANNGRQGFNCDFEKVLAA